MSNQETIRASDARSRLRRILDAVALVIISLSSLFWAWLRVITSDAIHGVRALAIPATVVFVAIGCIVALRAEGKLRIAAKGIVLVMAVFWLATLYHTGGHTVYFLGHDLAFAFVYKVVLCATACFTLSYMLAMVVLFVRNHPRPASHAVFVIGALIVVLVGIDLWFCIDPPVEPAIVGEYVYRRQYHPVFTYAVQDTYVTRDAREKIVRDYSGKSFSQVKPAGMQRIVLSGASTVWGHGLEGAQTLRSQMESKLNTRYPDRQWEVLCVAYQGKFQLNELVDTVSVLPQWKPDLVISLNGYNEIWYGETPGRYFGQPFIDEQTRLGVTETVLGRLTHLGPVLSALDRKPHLIAGTEVDPDIPPRYYDELRLSSRTLKGLGIPYVFSFCPNIFELSDADAKEQELRVRWDKTAAGDKRPKSEVVRERRIASDKIVDQEGQVSFDVMEMLKDAPRPRFIDECHLTAQATEVLANRLVEQTPEWIRKN